MINTRRSCTRIHKKPHKTNYTALHLTLTKGFILTLITALKQPKFLNPRTIPKYTIFIEFKQILNITSPIKKDRVEHFRSARSFLLHKHFYLKETTSAQYKNSEVDSKHITLLQSLYFKGFQWLFANRSPNSNNFNFTVYQYALRFSNTPSYPNQHAG